MGSSSQVGGGKKHGIAIHVGVDGDLDRTDACANIAKTNVKKSKIGEVMDHSFVKVKTLLDGVRQIVMAMPMSYSDLYNKALPPD